MSGGRAVTSTRWYWSDWLSDQALRACSYPARGLWVDLLCIAGTNKHDPGYVMLNGRPLSNAEIARMTQGTEAEVEALLAELEKNGVLSRDRRRVIYSRRMVRDEKLRRNGRLGPQAKALKQQQNPDLVAPLLPNTDSDTKKVRRKTPSAPRAPSDWPVDFVARFWAVYPKKADTEGAERKLAALHKGGKLPWAVLMAGLMRFAAEVTGWERRYVKSPKVWLNNGCWLDDYKQDGGSDGATRRGGGKGQGRGFGALAERLRGGGGAAPAGVRPDDGPEHPGPTLDLVATRGG